MYNCVSSQGARAQLHTAQRLTTVLQLHSWSNHRQLFCRMEQFRPNLVVVRTYISKYVLLLNKFVFQETVSPFQEEQWLKFSIVGQDCGVVLANFLQAKKCTRCEMINIDPDSGHACPSQPLSLIKRHREGLPQFGIPPALPPFQHSPVDISRRYHCRSRHKHLSQCRCLHSCRRFDLPH
jgi:uncharacterized protein YcbX